MKRLLAAILFFLSYIRITDPPAQRPAPAPFISGIASWYGEDWQGRTMANGIPFDSNKLTAASRTLKLGTCLLVAFPKTRRWVYVKVTDRGPFIRGRVLDLSERAARVLGLRPYGLGHVRLYKAANTQCS